MKKIIVILAAAVMLISAASCGKENPENNTNSNVTVSNSQTSKTCREIYNNVTNVVEFPEMVFLQEKSLSNRYGIESNMYTDYVFATAQEATLADTVVIIKTNSQDNKDAVVGKLNAFISQSQETNVDYNPDQYQIIKDASVKTSGDFVYLVFSKDRETVEQIISEAL